MEATVGPKYNIRLFSEENVRSEEANVARREEEVSEKARRAQTRAMFQPRFEVLLPRVEALGLTLDFDDDEVDWSDGVNYGYPYTQAGLEFFEASLICREEKAAKKAREEAAAKAKALAEAEAAELGLPANVTIWRRLGSANNRGEGWVVRPDGSLREADYNPHQGDLVWRQILSGEVVLRYHQATRSDIAHCEVVHRPQEVTPAQVTAAAQIEEDMGASENAFGLNDRLGKLIDRRIAAIEAAIPNLPVDLRLEPGWNYQALVSANGIHLEIDGTGWVNHADPFDERCEYREAQMVCVAPAADGELVALTYYKWGDWNINLLWRETTGGSTTVAPAEEEVAEPTDMATAMKNLREKFSR